jgi:hypothetical protein
MSLILSWVLTLRISFEDAPPLLALRSCCEVGMEGPEAVAAVTVLAFLAVGRLDGAAMAEGEEWEKGVADEDGLPPGRGAAMAARRESRRSDIS